MFGERVEHVCRWQHGCPDRARCNSIATNTAQAQFDCSRLGHADGGRLGCAVVEEALVLLQSGNRGGSDDRAAVTHVAGAILQDVVRTVKIQRDHAVQYRFVGIGQVTALPRFSGIVNDDVELADGRLGGFECIDDVVAVGDVGGKINGPVIQYRLRRCLNVGDDDSRAFLQEPLARTEADA